MNDFFSLTFFEYKPLKTVKTAAQQKRSANKNKYNMLYPLDAIRNAIKESITKNKFDSFNRFLLL